MTAPQPQRETTLRRCHRWVRTFALGMVVAIAVLLVAGHLALTQLNEQIRSHIERMLTEANPQLVVEVKSARRVNSQVIEVSGLKLRDPTDAESLLLIDEAQLACNTDWRRLCRDWSLEVTAIKLARPLVRARVTSEGNCKLTQMLTSPAGNSAPAPPIHIDDGQVELLVEAEGQWRRLRLRDVNLQVKQSAATSKSPSFIDVRGSFQGEHIDLATFHVRRYAPNGAWAAEGAVRGLHFSDRLLDNLPRVIADQLSAFADLRASSSFDFYVGDAVDGSPLRYRLNGTMYDGRINDPGFPYAFTDLSADFHVDQKGVEFKNLRARSGQTELQLSYRGGGFEPNKPFTLSASAERLPLDERLAASLPPAMRELWSQFQPSGEVGVEVDLHYDGGRWTPVVHVNVWRLNYRFKEFPYQVDNAQGVMHLAGDQLTIDLHTTIGGQRVDLDGDLQLIPNAAPLGKVTVQSQGPIAVDEKLISALGPHQQRVARALNFAGLITGRATFTRPDPQTKFRTHIDMTVSRGQMQYDLFPYPVTRIEGRIEFTEHGWRIINLEGFNNTAYLTAQGSFSILPEWGGDHELQLKIGGVDVPLDSNLRLALPRQSQEIWRSLAPRGTLDSLTVRIDKRLGQRQAGYTVIAKKAGGADARGAITLRPNWLPYRWDHVNGEAEFRDGQVFLRRLNGRHDDASLTIDAEGQFAPAGWRMDLNRISLENALLNREFVNAMRPERLRRMLLASQVSGSARVEGRMSFAAKAAQNSTVTSDWDLYVDLENGGLDLGAPVRAIRGGARLFGGYDGVRFRNSGSLSVDSMLLNDIHLTRVHGPLFADDGKLLLGVNAHQSQPDLPRQSVLAKAYQGDVRLDGVIGLEQDNPFAVRLSMDNGNMAQIVRQWSSTPDELRGRVNAALNLQGTGRGSHTWRGDGEFHLSQANIYRLPVMIGLLKLLSVQQPDDTAFTNGDALFRLQGEHVYFDRIDFSGDLFTLRGTGEMDLQRNINAQFYAAIGRDQFYVPVIRPLLGETSRSFLLIEVDGTLDNPDVRRKAFPEISQRLQQLLPPDVAERVSERPLLPRIGDIVPRIRRR